MTVRNSCVSLACLGALFAAVTASAAADPTYDGIVAAAEGAKTRNDAAQAGLRDACSLTDYAGKVKNLGGTNVWTEAFRAAVREHQVVRIPAGDYFVDGTVVLGSNRRIEAAAGAVIRMMPPMDTAFFVNDGARDGSLAPVDRSVANANIAIVGGRWEDWRRKRVPESFSGRWSDGVTKGGGGKGPWYGLSALMYVGNAKGVTFRDLTLVHASCFGIQTGDVEDFVCERLTLETCHADGVHVNGNVRNVLVRDVFGDVGDDLVALNFADWPCSSVNFGPGENVLVENLRLRSGSPWFRLLPYVHFYRDGSSVDCAARNVIVRRVRGVNEFKMYLQTRGYRVGKGLLDKAAVGSGGNIYFEDIEFSRKSLGPHVNADDPVRAHRGVFQIGANLDGVHIRNVRATMAADMPGLHLVSVGPISWVVGEPNGKLEVFDPWVSCDVKNLTLDEIAYPDGAPPEPVHCTVFDDINGDGLSSGRGRILSGDAGEAPNEIINSSYAYMLHDDGMPEQWNTYSGHNFDTFQPGVHAGRYYRMADEVTSPVKGARVVFVEGVYATSVRMGPLAGDTDYVFSVYAKSDAPKAELALRFAGKERKFVLSNDWQRLVLKAHLAKSLSEGSALIVYGRHRLHYAAPMLHAGTEPLRWKPNPSDAKLPDLRAGGQAVARPAADIAFEVPVAADWAAAKRLDEFRPLGDLGRVESSKYRAFVRRQGETLHVAVECDSGKKPSVPYKKGAPLAIGNDAVELFVSPLVCGSPFVQFMGGRNGACAATHGAQGSSANEGWSYRATETAKGWRAEYELPLAFFAKPDGDCWRLNIGVTDFDGVKPRYFSAVQGGFHAAAKFMRLTGLPRGVRIPPPRARAEFDFYTDEKTARVAVEDVQGEAKVTLRGFEGFEGFDGVGKVGRVERVERVEGVGKVERVEFDISSLSPGYYEVEVKAANGTARTHFRKAAAKHYARINRFKHQIEADGKPFFPMVYSWMNIKGTLPTDWQIAELKSHNFNTVMLTPEMWADWTPSGRSPDARVKTLRAFADAGFKFIIWSGASVKNGLVAQAAERAKHIEELAAFKQDILGWYYVDEIGPFWETQFNLKLSDFAAGYRAIKAVDPARLHFINWGWTNIAHDTPFYAEEGATDMYSLDCYPYTQEHYGYGALQIHENAARILNERIGATGMPGIMWLQTYGTNEGFREPMPVEYRNNVYVGLVNHVVGYMSFVGCPEHKDLWDEMGRDYGTALTWLDMTAQSGSECLARGRKGNIVYALWKNGKGGYALVAANVVYAEQGERLRELRGLRELWAGRAALPRGRNGRAGARPSQTQDIELVGGEGELNVGEDGALEIKLPSAGSAAWFIR